MFNNRKINELEENIMYLMQENIRLTERVGQLETPCKYKVGDKYNGGIITGITFKEYSDEEIAAFGYLFKSGYTISFFNTKTKKIESFNQII